jgi:membrane fusion protein (multidrug efflux system)
MLVFKRLILVLLLLGLVFGGIFYWKMRQLQQAGMGQGGPPPATVALTEVQAQSWQPRLAAIGTATATLGISVTNEIAGIVDEILFESGQTVERGDILVRLDASVDKAELKGLLAERDLAEIKYRRFAKLVKDRSASRSDLDEAKAELDSAEARVETKRALIAKKAITAPFAGQLGIRDVDLGQYLGPGSEMVSLQALDPIYVDFALPERELPKLAIEQPVEVRATARPDRTFSGRISAIDTRIDVATRTVRLRATLANPEGLLRPGMFTDVEVLQPVRDRVLTIPRTAVTYNPYGNAVFVAEEGDGGLQAQRRQVSTGGVNGERVEILDGLAVGERVVLAGQVKLRNGQLIEVDNSVLPEGGEIGP